ncbi:MAG: hypothetical protein RLZ60_1889, partial [Pseudomonadota bacterium]
MSEPRERSKGDVGMLVSLSQSNVEDHHQDQTEKKTRRCAVLVPVAVRFWEDFVADDVEHRT